MSDAELIESSLTDARAFAVIFDRHFRAIFRFLRGRIGPQLAEDLASETFVVAFGRRGSYDLSRDDARPWLYGIAVNLLREHRRAEERRLRAYASVPADLDSVSDEPGDHLDPTVSAALLELSHEERNLILLLTWADLTYEQLADALGLPVGTIRSRISRVRSKLRVRLAPVETGVRASGSGLAWVSWPASGARTTRSRNPQIKPSPRRARCCCVRSDPSSVRAHRDPRGGGCSPLSLLPSWSAGFSSRRRSASAAASWN